MEFQVSGITVFDKAGFETHLFKGDKRFEPHMTWL